MKEFKKPLFDFQEKLPKKNILIKKKDFLYFIEFLS